MAVSLDGYVVDPDGGSEDLERVETRTADPGVVYLRPRVVRRRDR